MKKIGISFILACATLLCNAQTIGTYFSTYSVLQGAPVPSEDWQRSTNGIRTTQSFPLNLEYPYEYIFERKIPKPKEGEPAQILPMLDNTKPAFEKKYYTFGSTADLWNASPDKQFLAIELFGCGSRVPMEIVDALRLAAADVVYERGRHYVADAQTVLDEPYNGEPVYYGGARGGFAMSPRMAKLYSKGVRYVLSLVVDEYRTHAYKKEDDPKAPIRFESAFSFHITGYDLDSQEILQTRLCIVRGDAKSLDHADEEAVSSARSEIRDYVNANFRVTAGIGDLGDPNKRDKIKTCTINAGFAIGAEKGDTFEVCTAGSNGKTNHLGRVRITNVLSDDRSECNISGGREKIISALGEGTDLILLSE